MTQRASNLLNDAFRIAGFVFSFEALFLLFLFAGQFKAASLFSGLRFDLTVIFFGLSVFASLGLFVKRKITLTRNSIVMCLLWNAFTALFALSLLWTPGHKYAILKVASFVLLTGWAVAGASIVISTSRLRVERFYCLLCVFCVVALAAAIKTYLSLNGGFIKIWGANYLWLGRTLGILLVISICAQLFSSFNTSIRFLLFITCLIVLYMLTQIGGRGPFVFSIATALVAGIYSIRWTQSNVYISRGLGGFLVVVLLSCIYLLFHLSNGLHATTLHRVALVLTGGEDYSITNRIAYLQQAFKFFADKPMFGWGAGSWPILIGVGDLRSYPHNIILEIAVEGGLALLASFFLLVGWGWYTANFGMGKDALKKTTFFITLFLLLYSMVSGDLNDNRLLFAFLGLLPMASSGPQEHY